MELDVCPFLLGLSGAAEAYAPQVGVLLEARMKEAIILSAPWRVESFRPVTDTGGIDWAACPHGDLDGLRLVQFKGTLHTYGSTPHVVFVFNAPRLRPHRRTKLVFALADPALREVGPFWVLPSEKLPDIAARVYCSYDRRQHWSVRANPAPDARDKASGYRVAASELAETIFGAVRPGLQAPALALSPDDTEKGAFFEEGFVTRFLQHSTGTEQVLRPDPDMGRDILGVTVDPFAWGSLSVKGLALKKGAVRVLQARIREQTFIPHRRHFVLAEGFDEASQRVVPLGYLIPSIAFVRLAYHFGNKYLLSASLHPNRSRWAPYAIPTEEDALRFMRAMRRPPPVSL